jgi:hypothetical protein
MKKLFNFLLVFIASSSLMAQNSDEKPYITKTYQASDLRNLKVETSAGGITVAGQSGSEARVEVYIRPNNWNGSKVSKEEIEERLENYVISIKKEGDLLTATAKRKNNDWDNWKKSLSIGFKVYIPEKISTDLQTSGGGISLKNLTGTQRFSTSGGGLNLANLTGDIKGQTSGGGIKFINCKEKINLSTSGGGITAEDSDGEIRLSTSGGGLKLTNLKGKIKATTSGGGVSADDIRGELITSTSGGSIKVDDMEGSLDASTSGGGITVDMKSLGSYLTLSTSAGGIHVNMPLDKGMDLDLDGSKVRVPELAKFSGTIEKDRVRGKLNGGGIPVKMDASSGGVYINE